MRVIHKSKKTVIDFMRQVGNIVTIYFDVGYVDVYLNLPQWFKVEGEMLIEIPFEEMPSQVKETSLQSLQSERAAIGFSDWQRTLVFTDKDIWLKEKTTKELYDLYLETL